MEQKDLCVGKKVILVVASQGFDFDEYQITKDMLQRVGVKVITASNKNGGAVAQDKRTTLVDIHLNNIKLSDYDGIFFIGGLGVVKIPESESPHEGLNAQNCLDIPISYGLISQAKKLDIPYGAIGMAVRILVKGYGLQGKAATGWNGDLALTPMLLFFGGKDKIDHEMVVNDFVVTARDASASTLFADGIIRVLRKKALGA